MIRRILAVLVVLLVLATIVEARFNPWNLVPSSKPAPICTENDGTCCSLCTGKSPQFKGDTKNSLCKIGLNSNNIEVLVTLNSHGSPDEPLNEQRFARFCVKVDELSQLNVNASFHEFLNTSMATDQATIQVDIAGTPVLNPSGSYNESLPYANVTRRFYSDGKTKHAGFFMINAYLNGGAFSSSNPPRFENTCDDGKCKMGGDVCTSDNTDCAITSNTDADVKIFIAWSGTDKMRSAMQSSGLLPTRYRTYALPSMSVIDEFLKKNTNSP